jgi:hypothetical protein
LHELVDVNRGVIVGVEFEQEISDCINKTDSFLIEVEQEFNHLLNVRLIIFLPEGNVGHDKGCLHLGLVQQLFLAPGLFEALENEGAWDRTENEHVEEDVEDEHGVVQVILFNGRQLVVRI